MPLLLLCVVLQALSLSQGLNSTEDRPSDKEVDLSTLSLSEGCSGTLRAFHQNTTVYVTLNLLDAMEKSELALQICERFACGRLLEHGTTATVQNGTCLADCILRDSKLHNCTTDTTGDCVNATNVKCEHQAVRLVEGRDRCAGRVELLHYGNWGTVCDDEFDERGGHIVCAQLTCGSAKRVEFFGAGTGVIHISTMKCNGSESSLWECSSQNHTASNYCGHKEDAGIVCSESVEITLTDSTTELDMTTRVAASTVVAEGSRGVSAAAIGCIILSIALLMFIILNVAACLHFKRRKALRTSLSRSATLKCVIHQHHSNSQTSQEHQSTEQIGIYNPQSVQRATGPQYGNLGLRMNSNYGQRFSQRTNRPTHNSDSSSDSDYEHYNRNRPQRLHLNNSSKDLNALSCTGPGEQYLHNVQISMDSIKSCNDPFLTPQSFGAPDTSSKVNVNDSSSTSSGEFYQNRNTDMDNMEGEKTPFDEKSPLSLLSCDNHDLPGTDSKELRVNDASSTSSGEFYQNTEDDKSREKTPSVNENSQFASQSYGHYLPDTDSQGSLLSTVDVNDSDSTSSGECYQNTEIDVDNNLQWEDEESPSLPEKSLQTPHSAQMTGNTAGYSGCRVPSAYSQDGNDSDSTSSGECYQNVQIDENTSLQYDEESPSLPETSFQNPHFAEMTDSTDGYGAHLLPRNLSQEADNSSTTSEASYVNVPPKNEEDDFAASSNCDYDDTGTW